MINQGNENFISNIVFQIFNNFYISILLQNKTFIRIKYRDKYVDLHFKLSFF